MVKFVGVYLKKMRKLTQEDTCTPVFTAVLFTVAKTWKQPKCPSVDERIRKMWYIYERIRKMWYIYAMEYYSAIKKNETLPSLDLTF